MKITIVVNGRCAGGNHVHLTVTGRRADDSLIGSRNITLTPEDIFGVEPSEFLENLPLILRSHLLEQGVTRQTPFAQIRTAIESKVFYI